MRWTPSQPNGWWPKLSPSGRRLLYGNDQVWVMDFTLGLESQIAPSGWHYGWLDDDTLLYCVGNQAPDNTAVQHKVTFKDDGNWTDVITACPIELASGNWLDANDNHWITGLGPRACFDGTVIATDGATGAKTAGGRCVWGHTLNAGTAAEVWGVRIWTPQGSVDFVPIVAANLLTLNRDGYVGFGYWGLCAVRKPDGTQVQVNATPWKKEGAPVVVRDGAGVDWVFTATVDPADNRALVLARPIGTTACAVASDVPGTNLSVVLMGTTWRIAGCSDVGGLVCTDLPLDAVRHEIQDRRPPMPLPVLDFTLNGLVATIGTHTGCYTHRWQRDDSNVAPKPGKPNDGLSYDFSDSPEGFHTIRLKAQSLPDDDAHATGTGGQVIFTTSQPLYVKPTPPPVPPSGLLRSCQTGFGEPIVGADNAYEGLKVRHWNAARVGAGTTSAKTDAILQEVYAEGLEPVVIATVETIYTLPLKPHLRVEFYNEPDIGDKNAGYGPIPVNVYVERVLKVLPLVQQNGWDFFTGGISNPDSPGLGWLAQVNARIPSWIGNCYHRYPGDDFDVASKPRKGYASRRAEFAALRNVTKSRRVMLTETGWKQDRMKTGGIGKWHWFGYWRALTDKEIAERIAEDILIVENENDRAAAAGQPPIEVWTWYQVWEALEDLFGLMHQDRTWKPQATLPA